MPAARAVCTHPKSTLETAKKKDRARAHGWAHRAAAHSTVGRVQHLIHRTRWLARPAVRDVRSGKVCARGESATWLSLRSVSSWLRLRTGRGRRGWGCGGEGGGSALPAPEVRG